MAKRDMVLLIATKLANTTVRGENARYNVHTNPDDPEVAELELERSIAVQLVRAGVGTIEGEDPADTLRNVNAPAAQDDEDDEGTGTRGGTIERHAARRRRRSLDADNAGGPSVSGADSRDTTAHQRNPLGGRDRRPDAGGAAPDDDAAPLDGAAGGGRRPAAGKAKAPARKRVRNRTKKAPAAAAGSESGSAAGEGADKAGADAPAS